MSLLRTLVSRKWIFTTVLVIAAVLVMARLGIWQLNRLDSRRAFNARVLEQQEANPIVLNPETISDDLYAMEYRSVLVQGSFIPEQEILLRNQAYSGQIGYQLFSPLLIAGTDQAILVQRGWIPEESATAADRSAYFDPGQVTVEGILRRPETDFGLRLIADPTLAPGEGRLEIWNNLDFERLSQQFDGSLVNMYIQVLSHEGGEGYPRPLPFQLELTEGSHLGYAVQWFLFAIILLVGFPIFVIRQNAVEERAK